MTALLSFLNVLFGLVFIAAVILYGRRRWLSERSSLICLAAGLSIFVFFKEEVFWQLLQDYPARHLIYHLLFLASWGVTAALVYGCVKLTEISRIKRKLVQDLALLNYEPAYVETSASELIETQVKAES